MESKLTSTNITTLNPMYNQNTSNINISLGLSNIIKLNYRYPQSKLIICWCNILFVVIGIIGGTLLSITVISRKNIGTFNNNKVVVCIVYISICIIVCIFICPFVIQCIIDSRKKKKIITEQKEFVVIVNPS